MYIIQDKDGDYRDYLLLIVKTMNSNCGDLDYKISSTERSMATRFLDKQDAQDIIEQFELAAEWKIIKLKK